LNYLFNVSGEAIFPSVCVKSR